MYFFVKMWTPKPAWFALEGSERASFIDHAKSSMRLLESKGIENISWFKIDQRVTQYDSGHAFCTLYRMQTQDAVTLLHKAMMELGWYTYFEQINATGETASQEEVMAALVKAKSVYK